MVFEETFEMSHHMLLFIVVVIFCRSNSTKINIQNVYNMIISIFCAKSICMISSSTKHESVLIKKNGMFLYSAVSSPHDRIQSTLDFTHWQTKLFHQTPPGLPCWKHPAMLRLISEDFISITVNSHVFIHVAE